MKKIMIFAMAIALTGALASTGIALKKDIKFKTVGSEGQVTFSHEIHTEKAGLKCNECHTKIFHMKAGADAINMAAIKDGKFCGTCHNGTKAFKATDAANCSKCHKK